MKKGKTMAAAKQGDKPKQKRAPQGPKPIYILLSAGSTGLDSKTLKGVVAGVLTNTNDLIDRMDAANEAGEPLTYIKHLLPRVTRKKAETSAA